MKTEFLQLRVLPSQKKAIRLAAEHAHLGMTEWILKKLFPPQSDTFRHLLANVEKYENTEEQASSLAELNDFLCQLTRVDFSSATESIPRLKLSPYLSNYVASMVETAAHNLHLSAPIWVREISPLDTPHFGSELISLRLYLLTNSPPAFRRRNIFIDATIGARV